jgi:hypothetical protein
MERNKHSFRAPKLINRFSGNGHCHRSHLDISARRQKKESYATEEQKLTFDTAGAYRSQLPRSFCRFVHHQNAIALPKFPFPAKCRANLLSHSCIAGALQWFVARRKNRRTYAGARDFACRGKMATLLLGLEVVEKDGAFLRLLTPVLDHDAAAVDDLSCVAFAVDLACDDTPVSKTVLSRAAFPSS